MVGWRHCAEVVFFVFIVAVAVTAFALVIAAIVKAWRIAKPLRHPPSRPQIASAEPVSEERKKQLADHWKGWRERYSGYATEYNQLVNPLRKDGIDIIKESANWGRLAIQYALIVNGGALAALPYLLSNTTRLVLPVGDAIWSAVWFTAGLFSAAICCLVAYLDFQVTAAIYGADQGVEIEMLRQRHFETTNVIEPEPRIAMRLALFAVTIRTGLAGITFGIIAWFAFAWGAIRLINSLAS